MEQMRSIILLQFDGSMQLHHVWVCMTDLPILQLLKPSCQSNYHGSDVNPLVEHQHLHQSQLLPPHIPLHFNELCKNHHRRGQPPQTLTLHLLSPFPLLLSLNTTTTPNDFYKPPHSILLPALSFVNCKSWGYSLSVCKQPIVPLQSSHCTPNLRIPSILHTSIDPLNLDRIPQPHSRLQPVWKCVAMRSHHHRRTCISEHFLRILD
jgi:hypothetical protein